MLNSADAPDQPIPVVDAGMRPVGIVSRTDIINAFGVMQ
ncbi:MAG: CBS domain-containing protein [Bilophila wadsworthia]